MTSLMSVVSLLRIARATYTITSHILILMDAEHPLLIMLTCSFLVTAMQVWPADRSCDLPVKGSYRSPTALPQLLLIRTSYTSDFALGGIHSLGLFNI